MNLITNTRESIFSQIKKSMMQCNNFYFVVSFIRFSGVQMLLESLKEAEKLGIKGKIITTDYMGITEKKAVETLLSFTNIELKYFPGKFKGFHPKGYIFNYSDKNRVIIGSSNISQGGLKSNIEWNSDLNVDVYSDFSIELMEEFNSIWKDSIEYDENFTEKKYSVIKSENIDESAIKPNYMQKIALDNLNRIISTKENRALGISATGTGKTYLAVFHANVVKPKKLLFIAHRDEILQSAKKSFKKVIKDKTFGTYMGAQKELDCDYIFSSIQTLSRNYKEFSKDYFDYIVIDEAHHSSAHTYKKIIEYFNPKFLLGLSATPERSDGENIYDIYHGNIVMEIRLKEALDYNLVAPFHYFGITDIAEIDLENIDLNKVDLVAKKLMIHKRTEYILEKINFYKFSGKKMKALGFCANVEHAEFMAKEFNKFGINAVAITGKTSSFQRKTSIELLESDSSDLKIIFTVDIFNEGVDIPNINLILMLRPTNSPTIFIQQLGRGLRKSKDKDFVTILDFIGNHKKSFLIAMALTGNESYDKDYLRTSIETDFQCLSKNIHISMDEISKKQILEQIENENFNTLKYLKEEYFSFKNILDRVPNYLDFINYESAPSIYKYILKFKSYYGFLNIVEKDIYKFNEQEIKIIEEIESFLPIKRIYEYVILKNLLKKEYIIMDDVFNELKRYLDTPSMESVIHAFNNLNWAYLDDGERKKKTKLILLEEDSKIFKSEIFKNAILNINFKTYIENVILFGLLEYEKKFGSINYGLPFLKLYEEYSMKEVALLSNYKKIHSSYRNGVNPSEDKKNYYMFINLEKDNKNKFDNIIFSRKHFNWFTKSTTKVESQVGQNFLKSEEKGINLHFFMRKFNKIEGITQPFVYIGKGKVISYEGEQPIKCKIELDSPIEINVYKEFIL